MRRILWLVAVVMLALPLMLVNIGCGGGDGGGGSSHSVVGFWNLASDSIGFPVKMTFHPDGSGYEIHGSSYGVHCGPTNQKYKAGQQVPFTWRQSGSSVFIKVSVCQRPYDFEMERKLTWHGIDSFTWTTQGSGHKGVYVRSN